MSASSLSTSRRDGACFSSGLEWTPMRYTASSLMARAVFLGIGLTWGADPPTLEELAAAIEGCGPGRTVSASWSVIFRARSQSRSRRYGRSVLRKKGFAEAGLTDPRRYAA